MMIMHTLFTLVEHLVSCMVRTGGRGVNTGNIGIVGTNGEQTSAQDVTASGVAVLGDLHNGYNQIRYNNTTFNYN